MELIQTPTKFSPTEYKNTLRSIVPKTKEDALHILGFCSLVGNQTTLKSLKTKAYEFLNKRCKGEESGNPECERFVSQDGKIMVTKIMKNVDTVVTPTARLTELEAEMEKMQIEMADIKKEMELEKSRSGVKTEQVFSHYLVKFA